MGRSVLTILLLFLTLDEVLPSSTNTAAPTPCFLNPTKSYLHKRTCRPEGGGTHSSICSTGSLGQAAVAPFSLIAYCHRDPFKIFLLPLLVSPLLWPAVPIPAVSTDGTGGQIPAPASASRSGEEVKKNTARKSRILLSSDTVPVDGERSCFSGRRTFDARFFGMNAHTRLLLRLSSIMLVQATPSLPK